MNYRIEKSIELKASQSRVWKALTDSKEFGAWFRVQLEGPFLEGQVTRGKVLYPGYEHVIWHARVQKIEPETLFSFTWHPYAVEKERDYSQETPTLVEFHVQAKGPTPDSGCTLTVIESGFENLPEQRRLEAFRMNEGGWELQMENIGSYVTEKPQ